MQIVNYIIGLLLYFEVALCSSRSAIKLTELAKESDNYIIDVYNSDLSILEGPRDYFTVLIFTSSNAAHNCKQCEGVKNVVAKVARSWFSDHVDSHLLTFINIDLNDPKNGKLFNLIGLQTVPHIWLVAPNPSRDYGDPNKILEDAHLEFKMPQVPQDKQALEFAQFLSEQLQKPILIRDEDALAKFIKTFVITFSVIVIIRKKGPSRITATKKKTILSLVAIAIVLLFTCGYQFTIQNSVPFVAKSDKGGVVLISGGQYYQFGIETFLVGANYASLAGALLLLTYIGRYKVTEKSFIASEDIKVFLVLFVTISIYLLYSCLTSIVLRKDQGYPYSFTKLF
ncbi:oligosaccharyltransferase complex subunit, putative [Candida dubliniensis CD36]|uniref:Oligosaccharyltransferase complex subunit, putative n=1 Tax=Candida dubliniensis (strain CD36 / ATCC MYA-646 / CBS 7987 / NCPF 3949 / NRRL Y-17841) TaxID=573826 RepID=B9WEM2_CANDC|nr:oligosaccharyltransferase complex subunit, putative [Candida dubliniensis CD36]CAX43134.1 oligosaccharyltransferase complex subunit, putative [Candida dubliniensis CD36]